MSFLFQKTVVFLIIVHEIKVIALLLILIANNGELHTNLWNNSSSHC